MTNLHENFIIHYVLICIIFYLIGSFPTAYVVMKKKFGKDITKEGSGNVGAYNSFEVSNSKHIGIIVLVLDFLKGFIPALIMTRILEIPFFFSIIPLILLVFGHNFSVWLRFKGGMGLATSAGIFCALNFWIVIIWCLLYYPAYAIRKDITIGNVAATLLLPLIIVFLKPFLAAGYTQDFELLFAFSSSICLIILLKHIKPILKIIKDSK